MKRHTYLYLLLLLALQGCLEPFSPPEIEQADTYLVVDGSLNTTPGGSSEIRLSRTQKVQDDTSPPAELRARLTVEGEQGSRFTFVESDSVPGLYRLPPVPARPSEKYRLRIVTQGGHEYLSAYVPVVKTPLIDSLTYRVFPDRDGIRVLVNAHDATGQNKFYRWSYDETWEYQASLPSFLEVVMGKIVGRTEDINTCWSTAKPSTIILASTIKLSQDIVRDQTITLVPVSTGKLRKKYSILVKQYGLTQDEYEYWNTLSRNTERSGSLFDPQPAQVTGNIKSTTDDRDLVFGYFSATNRQDKRIFVTEYIGRNRYCIPDTIEPKDARETTRYIVGEYYPPGTFTPLYLVSDGLCADCRVQGGVNRRPPFWQ